MIQIGNAVFDASAHLLRDAAGTKIALRSQTLRVLECLIQAKGGVLSKAQLALQVWGSVAVTDDSLVQCIGEIRSAIGDTKHEILQTEHRLGYRLAASVQAGHSYSVRPEPNPVRAEPVEAVRQAQGERSGAPDGQAAPAIAVMAFTSMEGDERSERLAMTFAGDLSAELARHRELRVISRLSSFSLKGQALGTREICERLNARFIVSGQVQFSEDAIDWSLEMSDGHSDDIVWSERKKIRFTDIETETAALIWRMAGSIDHSFRVTTIARTTPKAPDSLNAYDLVSRAYAGIHNNSVEGSREAQRLAALAVQHYPTYGRAWRALAHAHAFDIHSCHTGEWTQGRIGENLVEIRKAIELDNTSPVAYAVLGTLLSMDGQLAAALTASDRALELGQGEPQVLHLRAVAFLFLGQFQQAMAMMASYRAIVPILPSMYLEIWGRILLAMGDLDAAIQALQQALTLAPSSIARLSLIVALEEKGEHVMAAEHFKTLLTHTNGFDEGYFGKRYDLIPGIRGRYVNALRVHGLKPEKPPIPEGKVPLSLVKRA